jgi:hypothetical protein
VARTLAQKRSKSNFLGRYYKRSPRNNAIYQRVKGSLDRGILSVVAEEFGITRERARQIFRNEEMLRGDVFHQIINGNARRLDK